jgi:hypothetical protein
MRLLRLQALVIAMVASAALAPTQARACSGTQPQAPVCNAAKCTADGWVFWPVPAGTRCNSGLGYCDGGVLGPKGQIEPDALGLCLSGVEVRPRFHLQSIIYMPPGAQSSVTYATGSSEGSRTSIQTTTSQGGSVGFSVFGIGPTVNYSQSVINGNSLSVNKTDTYTRGESVNTGRDAPERGSDVFDLWFNASMMHYLSSSNGWERIDWSTVGGAPMSMYSFTADELLGNKPVSGANPSRLAAFNSLTTADKTAILWMNGPLTGAPLDPRRYQHVELQNPTPVMYGPYYPGAPVNTYGYSVAYNKQYDATNGSTVNSSTTVLAGFNIEVVRLGGSYTWAETFTDTRTTSTGSQKAATITLRTSTVGCYMAIEFYIDAVFGTYLALPTYSQSCL